MQRRPAGTWLFGPLLLLVLAAAVRAAEPLPRVVGVRVGEHAAFTRLVVELDRGADYRIEPRLDPLSRELEVRLDALGSPRELASHGLLEWARVDAGPGGVTLRMRVNRHPVTVKDLVLSDPPRIVFDLHPATSPSASGLAEPLPAAASVSAPPPPRRAALVAARMGVHDRFTRVVFELDRTAEYALDVPGREGDESVLLVLIDAEAGGPKSLPATGLVESLEVRARGQRAVALVRVRELPVHVERFVLSDPPRIVLDLRGDAGTGSGHARP